MSGPGDNIVQIGGNVFLLPGSDAPMHSSEAKDMRKAAYLEWCLLPRSERTPKTKREVADLLGVTTATLLNYEKEPDFRGEVQRRLGATFRVDRLADLFKTLYEIATDANNPRAVSAARTLLEWSERSTEHSGMDLSHYSDEELEEARRAIVQAT